MPLVIPLVALADVLILALVGVLSYYGSVALGHIMGAFLSRAPVVGSWLAGQVEGLASQAAQSIHNLVNASAAPVIALFSTPARVANSFVASAVAAARRLSDNVVWVATELMPSVGAALTSEINGTAVNIERWISGTVVPPIDSVIGVVQGQVAQAYRDLSGQQSQLTGVEQAVGAKAGRDELAATDAVVGRVQSQVAGQEAALASQQSQLTSIGAAVGAVPGYVDTKVGDGVRAAEGYTNGAVAGVEATLAPAIAGAAALATEAATFVRDCGEPMCNWWHDNSNPLASLLAAVGLVELTVLVTEAARDPEAVGRAVAADFEVVAGLGSAVTGLFGL